jgi:prevent-host-death family protein
METAVNVHEAKTTLSRLLKEVEAGAEVVIARSGVPVAKLSSISASGGGKRQLGTLRGLYTMPDDFDRWGEEEIAELFGVA